MNFAGSIRAAKSSAPSLSAFLKELHTQLLARKGLFKLVLITHSLGAEVALEALNLLYPESTGWVTGTLLVQPAVTIASVTDVDFPEGFAKHGLPMDISTDARVIALNGSEHNRLFDDSKLAEELYQKVLFGWLQSK